MKKIFALTLSLTLLITTQARADDDAKRLIGGIAAGLVGMALENASNDSQTQAEEIQWNDHQKPSSEPQLEYRDDVAEAQLKLKKLGFYHGKIDGLKGADTTDAIETWEYTRKGKNVDGEISPEEMIALNRQIASQEEYEAAKKQKATPESNASVDPELFEFVYSIQSAKAAYNSCKQFRETGNVYAYSMNDNLDKNYKNLMKLYEKTASELADCKNISSEQLSSIKDQAEAKYSESDEAMMYKFNTALVSSGEENQQQFVKGCNTISEGFSIMYVRFKDQRIDEQTCEFK